MILVASVVVPTYRRPELLERCLGALAMQDFDPTAYEVVVADDGCDEATRAQVERWAAGSFGRPRIRYLPVNGTQGPAAARNLGWRNAQGRVIAFTDDDTVPHPDWLAAGCRAFRRGVVAAAGRVLVPIPNSPTDYERDIARMGQAEFVTANCFVLRTALEAVGGFDERFTAAWREDSDLHFKLLDLPGRVVKAPEAMVKHPVRAVPGWTYPIRQHRKIAFDALLFKKHPRLYRERIRRLPPLHYYAMVAALAVALVALATGSLLPAGVALATWAALTAAFAVRRLRGTSRSRAHVAEMIASSVAIPFVAVYWRLLGAWRYRVLFM